MRLHTIPFWGALGLAACLHGAAYGQGGDTRAIVTDPSASAAVFAPAPVAVGQAGTAGTAGRAPTAGTVPIAVCDDEGAPFGVPPLSAQRLAQWRGGSDTVTNDMRLNGTVAGNTAVNVATGTNIITNGSFSNASGLPVAIQNSGANVLIQNATIINVELK